MPRSTSDAAEGSATTSTAFKDHIDAALIARLAAAFVRVDPSFPVERFSDAAVAGLAPLELKARVAHVAAALDAALPDRFAEAARIVDGVVALPVDGDGHPGGLTGWDGWPLAEWVGLAGRSDPAVALDLLSRVTRLASGEFAIRGFIDDDPDAVLALLEGWLDHDDEHVRRLVTEGTRPKLPWAPKLAVAAGNPGYAVALLDRAVDDDSEYVRRSVSNHLNDLCRLSPELALEVATRWTEQGRAAGGETERRIDWVVRRGIRTLVKAGNPAAMRLLGHEPDLDVVAELQVLTPQVVFGGQVEWRCTIESHETATHRVVLDYAIHWVRANGTTGRKVFKWTTVELVPGVPLVLERRHRIVPITTRTYYSGVHVVEVQLNGAVVATGEFELQV
ncbi:MAG: DNA alkylation repair protein [Actinomycetota bacterium]|nr:DNA alkylation repair protein [Actinomycetota bacterium]